MFSHTEFEQILATPHTNLLTVELDGFRREMGIEQVSAQVTREAIVSQTEWVDDAGKHRLLKGLSARFVLSDVQRGRENGREEAHGFW